MSTQFFSFACQFAFASVSRPSGHASPLKQPPIPNATIRLRKRFARRTKRVWHLLIRSSAIYLDVFAAILSNKLNSVFRKKNPRSNSRCISSRQLPKTLHSDIDPFFLNASKLMKKIHFKA